MLRTASAKPNTLSNTTTQIRSQARVYTSKRTKPATDNAITAISRIKMELHNKRQSPYRYRGARGASERLVRSDAVMVKKFGRRGLRGRRR